MKAPALVFVHSPFVGASAWKSVASICGGVAQNAVVPSLHSGLEREPPHYGALALTVAHAAHGFEDIALIVHSGAGSLVSAIVDACSTRIRARIRTVLFVDAVLTHPGRSWLQTLPAALRDRLTGVAHAGRLPPWDQWFPAGVMEALIGDEKIRAEFVAELPRVRLTYADEIAPRYGDRWRPQCAYLRLSAGYEAEAVEAERFGWQVRRENLEHLAMLSNPERVAELLHEVLGTAGTSSYGRKWRRKL